MKVAVLIATSMRRSNLLSSRSLKSVLGQSSNADAIVVVDDNDDADESSRVKTIVESSGDKAIYLKNTHVHGMSGTGAWNTGIEYINETFGGETWVAILDDDDEWESDHLSLCKNAIEQSSNTIVGVFPWLYRTDSNETLEFAQENLTIKEFMIGDPGIQGSNMVIKCSALMSVGGFDESLASCTDRDLMIRLLTNYPKECFSVIPKRTVKYCASNDTVTNDNSKKHAGLDGFYRKYYPLFNNSEMIRNSLKRAEKFFKYKGLPKMNENMIAIGVALHNNAGTIVRCLRSIAAQRDVRRIVKVVIGDDASTDGWEAEAKPFIDVLNVDVLHLDNRNVAKTRNAINSHIRSVCGDSCIVGRLDADDEYASANVLSAIERLFDEDSADVVIGANGYLIDGELVDYGNWNNKNLTDLECLRRRVNDMAGGIFKAELPSCNLFARAKHLLPYPDVTSAEDHFLTARYLAYQACFKVVVTDDVVVTNYSLSGDNTKSNRQSGAYNNSRRMLQKSLNNYIKDNERIAKALNMLNAMGIEKDELVFLGVGMEGIVFHDVKKVYKVFVPIGADCNTALKRARLIVFENKELESSKHFYRVEFMSDYVISYDYEPSQCCEKYDLESCISFLTECWRYKIAVKDCKPSNFVVVNGVIKLIDMECSEYNDNLFLNMCARMYLLARYTGTMNKTELLKLRRSAINNFDIPELSDNFREFVNRVYSNIIYEESAHCLEQRVCNGSYFKCYAFEDLPNLEALFFNKLHEGLRLVDVTTEGVSLSERNYFKPSFVTVGYERIRSIEERVSLLVKCCPQDVMTLEANVRHIVRQLYGPEGFCEVVLGIDPYIGKYLREYYNEGSLKQLIDIADKLKSESVIDDYFVYPDNEEMNARINRRWFGIESKFSHTEDLKPICSQLYAIEMCKGDYVLQTDSDVMIGRVDMNHVYLSEMLAEIKKNESVVSVGFNIPNKESKPYFGFEDGGFVPEIRLGLFDKKRLLNATPLPNSLDANGKLTQSWFRALQEKQKQTGLCSIRGGDKRTYYIHPQNYRKKLPNSWMPILDRVEQLYLPECQVGKFDCYGSLMEWCGPKRNEDLVVVSVFRNVSYDRFLRFWASLIAQSDNSFGIILYDDASDNGLPVFIDSLIRGYEDRVTFIKGRCHATRMENEYACIHNYMSNQESVVVMVDGDDALIGNSVIQDIHNLYDNWGCDVVVGRYHQTYRIQPHYRYPADFTNPRKRGGNVWQHTKSFKKYLFDSVPLPYFMHNETGPIMWRKKRWYETVDDFAMMVPIVELSERPYQTDFVNYYYEQDYEHKDDDRDLKEELIGEILNKEPLKSGAYTIGRKRFVPKFDKIEIDITYNCNLKCKGCNRSCSQAPTNASINIEQIRRFINESTELGIKWKLINILGGEPTLHRDFVEIVKIIKEEYKDKFSHDTRIQVVSNGYIEKSRQLCEKVKNLYGVVIDYNSFKTGNNVDYFTPFNDAPIDHEEYKNADFTYGCWVASYCGLNLNCNGYYACSVCGATDRVMKMSKGAQSLKELTEERIKEQMNDFCRYCGNFSEYSENQGDCIKRSEKGPFREIVSKSWVKIYDKYERDK